MATRSRKRQAGGLATGASGETEIVEVPDDPDEPDDPDRDVIIIMLKSKEAVDEIKFKSRGRADDNAATIAKR